VFSVPKQLSLLDLSDSLLTGDLMPEHEFVEALSALIPEPTKIILTHNRSSLISVHVEKGGTKVARIQHAFRAADKKTMKALARFLHKADKRSGRKVDAFLRENHDLVEAMAREPNKTGRVFTRVRHHDLKKILVKVMKDYGFRVPKVRITWSGKARKVKARSTIKFGSYCYQTRIISIHPKLDSPQVPEYFVEYIIYHELLHALFPPPSSNDDRREVHTKEFKRFERKFKRYEDAYRFEKIFMETMLR